MTMPKNVFLKLLNILAANHWSVPKHADSIQMQELVAILIHVLKGFDNREIQESIHALKGLDNREIQERFQHS
ncbi:hypothetical protein U1Q18_006999, partial [Sarracenia purpurea var. burkii]